MKKMLAVLALFGFGMMVGCGDDTGPKKTTGTSTTKSTSVTTGESTKTTTAPAKDTK